MLISLPNKKDGLSSLENIDAKHLMNISSSMFSGNFDVSLPKFKLESTFKLNDCLKELGMPDVFDMGRADLSGISASEQLYVSHVIHKAYVDVNEEGTEAAAATVAIVAVRSMPIVHKFTADHPFLFVIQDKRIGVPLFIGRFVMPTGDKVPMEQQQQQLRQKRNDNRTTKHKTCNRYTNSMHASYGLHFLFIFLLKTKIVDAR